jgi:hypothetical protein
MRKIVVIVVCVVMGIWVWSFLPPDRGINPWLWKEYKFIVARGH